MVRPAGLLSNRYKLEDMPDLTGKVAVVVGGSRGIGEAATAALIMKGAEGESARS
jgi:WW domain-containing oxidoreductase